MIYIDKERCNGCGECLSICPVGAISLQGDKAFIDESLCKSCDACLSVCPLGAILSVEIIDPVVPAESMPVPALVPEEVIHVQPYASPSLAKRALPFIGSALLWAGREVVPRLTSLALDMFDRRNLPANKVSPDKYNQSGERIMARRADGQGGRRRRKRHRGNR